MNPFVKGNSHPSLPDFKTQRELSVTLIEPCLWLFFFFLKCKAGEFTEIEESKVGE
jgi:hypothetical protein